MKCGLTPCTTCPWRRDTGGGPDIPGFGIEQARALSCTVGEGDAFRQIMACHGSSEDDNRPCAGYLAAEGYSNLNVRMLAAEGQIPMPAIVEACADLDLFESFEEMHENLERIEEEQADYLHY